MLELMQPFFNIPISVCVFVFIMGFIGSAVNSFAGGGTFLAFPVLLWAGLPPIIANATCKVAFIPGNIASAWAYRRSFLGTQKIIISMLMIALVGGTIGAFLTLYIGNDGFKIFIPWLILGATVLTWRGSHLTKLLQKNANSCMSSFVSLFGRFLLLLTSIYGGFFGAGIGVLLIATLNFYNIKDINAVNAIKNVMSVLINLAAVVMYCIWGVVDWHFALIQMLGAVLGGYLGGVLGRSLNAETVRAMITMVGFILALIYFYKYGYLQFLF
jgi:uncharacterized protein